MPDASAASIGAYSPQKSETTKELTKEIRSVFAKASGFERITWRYENKRNYEKKRLVYLGNLRKCESFEASGASHTRNFIRREFILKIKMRSNILLKINITYFDLIANGCCRGVHPDGALQH
jgi:hypothetical protein